MVGREKDLVAELQLVEDKEIDISEEEEEMVPREEPLLRK